MFLYILHQALHPALKLPAELGTGHQPGQVQHVDLFLSDLGRHFPLHNALGDALGDGGFAHARFTDKAGVILGAAVQNLHHPVDLLFPPDDGVHLTLTGLSGQVLTVVFQVFILGRAFFGFFLFGRRVPFPLGVFFFAVHHPAKEVLHKGERHGPAFFKAVLAILHIAHHFHHLVAHFIQVLLGKTHLIHQVIHRLQAQLLGAWQAQPLAYRLSILHPGHIDDRQPLFAAGAQHIVLIHRSTSFRGEYHSAGLTRRPAPFFGGTNPCWLRQGPCQASVPFQWTQACQRPISLPSHDFYRRKTGANTF